jgi:hypothetical protein
MLGLIDDLPDHQDRRGALMMWGLGLAAVLFVLLVWVTAPSLKSKAAGYPLGGFAMCSRALNEWPRMSAFGTKRTSRRAQSMSAIGGKADMTRTCPDVCFRPKADIGRSGLLPCKLIPDTHSADHKSLL